MDESGANSELALGKALQQARQTAGLTQQELCHQAGLSYSTLAKIERGAIKSPSVFTIQKVASILRISMDDLLGAIVDADTQTIGQSKKTSKSGISFLYLDINGCLVQFFHTAFTQISIDTGVPSDLVETTFWHYNDAVCRGEMAIDEFNSEFAEKLGLKQLDWTKYYLQAIEPIEEMQSLVVWAAQHYKVGLLSNIMPGFINMMIDKGVLPNVEYSAVIDSSVVGSIKPEQTIYDVANKAAGVAPNEILFVDDGRTNLMAAERLGWRVMWFDDYRPQQSVEKIRKALEF